MGQAEATSAGYASALKLFDYFQREVVQSPPFEDLVFGHVEADNLQCLLMAFGSWLARQKVPRYHDPGTLAPRRNDPGTVVEYLTVATKVLYFGKVKTAFKQKFPDHPEWSRSSDPEEWWTSMRAGFERECDRNQLRSEDTFGDKTRALYRSNRDENVSILRDTELTTLLQTIDLSYVCGNLMKRAGLGTRQSYEKRCWLIMTYLSAGRGGEVKFQQYRDWVWDPRFQITNTHWTELKTLSFYAMAMVPDSESYHCDFYHALGSFFAVENGLFRTHADGPKSNFVFPSLHALRDAGVTSLLTTIIRDNLPAETPAQLKKSFKAKSMRRASITELALHPQIGLFESTGRSGHSTGTTQDSYIDKMCIAVSLPGGRALSGWKNVRDGALPPRIACLSNDEIAKVQKFIEKLIVISIDDFGPNGILRPVLETAVASLIMYHPKVSQDQGTHNQLVTKMLTAAREACISAQVLAGWATTIAVDFKAQNPELSNAADLVSCIQVINQQSNLITAMNVQLNNMAKEQQTMLGIVQNQAHELIQLKDGYTSLAADVSVIKKKMKIFHTPPATPNRWATLTNETQDDNSEEGDQQRPNAEIHYNYQAETVSSRQSSASGNEKVLHVKDIIAHLWNTKKFQRLPVGSDLKFQDIDIPLFALEKEKSKYESTMELLDLVTTSQQREKLRKKDLGQEDLLRTAEAIESAAFQKMLELEGKTDAPKQMKASYTGLGRRIASWKKNSGSQRLGEAPAPGTPPDNRSLFNMFPIVPRRNRTNLGNTTQNGTS